jgi:hypothetical protein
VDHGAGADHPTLARITAARFAASPRAMIHPG